MRSTSLLTPSLLRSALRHAILGLGAVVMLAPFVMMVAISLKSPGEVFAPAFKLLPDVWYAHQNYTDAFTEQPLARYLLNGVIVGAAIFFFQALFAVPCAYALAKLRWRGRETTFVFVLLGLLIPPQVTAIPLYIGIWKLGLLDTYAAIVLPSTISVFGIFLMRQFFRTVPDDLLHAARLDGLSEFAIVWRIMLPMAVPAIHGLNRQRTLEERNIPVDLKPFMDADPQTKELGFSPSLLSLGAGRSQADRHRLRALDADPLL
jgi:multiple sugar transport system permease protein